MQGEEVHSHLEARGKRCESAHDALAFPQIGSRWKKAPKAPIQSPLPLDSFHYKKERKAELCAALIKLGKAVGVRSANKPQHGTIERNVQ